MSPARFTTIIIALLFTSLSVNGQARVTGHVFAEVVETAGMTSEANQQVALRMDQNQTRMDLGAMTISGGACTAGAIVITTSSLTSVAGTVVPFHAEVTSQSSTPVLSTSGNEVINLSGNVDPSVFTMEDRLYAAQYNVVFAYN